MRRQSSTACCGPRTFTASASSSDGVEVDEARAVHDRVEPVEAREIRLREAAAAGSDTSPATGTHFSRRKASKPAPWRARSGSNGAARRDLVEEPRLGGAAGAGAHEHEHPADVGVAVEEHRQRDLADEAGRAGDEERASGERARDVERGALRGPRTGRRAGRARRARRSSCARSSEVLGHDDGRVVEQGDLRAAPVDGARHVDRLGERLRAVPAHAASGRTRCRRRRRSRGRRAGGRSRPSTT